METIKIKNDKAVKYPDMCPVCGRSGGLRKLPIDDVAEEVFEGKKSSVTYIPIHRPCWRFVENRGIILTAVTILVVIVAAFILVAMDYDSRGAILAALPVLLLIYVKYPIPIEVSRDKETTTFVLRNYKYKSTFKMLNQDIIIRT